MGYEGAGQVREESFADFLKTLSFYNIIEQEISSSVMASKEWMKSRFASFLKGPAREWDPGTLEFCRAQCPELAEAVCKGLLTAEAMIMDGAGMAEFESVMKSLEESCRMAMNARADKRPF